MRTLMRMWTYSACVESGKDGVCCVNRRYFPCIWERIMKHDVHEPFRAIHGCIRRERNLETGHDAIPRSFNECMLAWLDSDAVCLIVSVISASYRVSAATDHRNGRMFTQEKEGLGNRMTSRKPHGWRHGFGLDCTHCQHDGR